MKNILVLNSSKLFLSFLFLLPLMNIISNRISPIANYIFIFVLLFFIMLTKQKRSDISSNMFLFLAMQISILTFVILYKVLVYQSISMGTMFVFLFNYIMFLLFIMLSTNMKLIVDKYFLTFVNFILIMSFITIISGYIVLYTSLPDSWQFIYRSDLGHDYLNRAFGLFGQPSVNMGILIFTYLIRLYLIEYNKINEVFYSKVFYFIIVSLSVYYQHTGTGYLGYILLILILLSNNKVIFTILLASLIFGVINFYFIYQDEINLFSNKLSFEYVEASYHYFYDRIIKPYSNELTIFDLLFGIDDDRNIPIDFGPVYFIAHTGLIYTITFTSFIVYLVIKIKHRYISFAFILLFFVSLHYPIVIYPVPSVFYFLLLIHILKNKEH